MPTIATATVILVAIVVVIYAYLYTTVPKIHEHFVSESKKEKTLKKEYEELKKKYRKNTQEEIAAKDELYTLKKTLRRHSHEKEASLHKGALLEYDVEKAQAAHNKVKLEVNALKSYFENLQKEYMKTGKTLDAMKEEYTLDKEKCSVIDTTLVKSKVDYVTLQKEVEGAASQISELKKQLALMTTKNDPLASTLTPVLEDRQKQKLELDKKLAETGAKLKAELTQKEQLKKKLTLDEDKLALLNKQHSLAEQLLVKTEAKFKSESSEKKKREVDLKQLNDSVSVNDSVNKKIQEDVNKMRDKFNKVTQDEATTAGKIVAMRTKTTNQSIEIKKLQQAIEEMTKAKAAAAAAAAAADASFMVLGGKGKLAYTTDGKTATLSKSGSEYYAINSGEVRSIGFNGKQWIAAGCGERGTKLAISADGNSWTPVPSLDNKGAGWASFNSCLWTGSLWMLTSDYNLGKYYSSPDGITWTQMTKVAGNVNQFAGNDACVVACGVNVNMQGSAIYYSNDKGSTWIVAPSAQQFFTQNGGLSGVVHNGNMFVSVGCASASGAEGIVIYSSDGINWNKAVLPDGPKTNRFFSIFWNGKMWLAVGNYVMLYSKDAVVWQKDKRMIDMSNDFFMSSPNNSIRASMNQSGGFAYDGKSWHVMSTYQNAVWSSPDGINWADPSCKNVALSSVFGSGEGQAIASARVLPW